MFSHLINLYILKTPTHLWSEHRINQNHTAPHHPRNWMDTLRSVTAIYIIKGVEKKPHRFIVWYLKANFIFFTRSFEFGPKN